MNSKLRSVITTIQQPTDSVITLVSRLRAVDSKLIVIGDKKGPASYGIDGVEFFSLRDQLNSAFDLARTLPIGHYARKNIGYLLAISQGASCIYETDDDNAPLDSWGLRQNTVAAQSIQETGWVNVFRLFSAGKIWPRGFPLGEVDGSLHRTPTLSEEALRISAPIQQGLSNNSPDVDAIWRLIMDEPFEFEVNPSVYLPRGAWCPFNSQSTWWFPVAYPLMYLPSYCSFRMTDIWRSFVAQRCLWELEKGVVFHGPEVIQQRNAHDLMRDFQDEIPGYTRTKELVDILEHLRLAGGVAAIPKNMMSCYQALVQARFFDAKEMALLTDWLTDVEQLNLTTSEQPTEIVISRNA